MAGYGPVSGSGGGGGGGAGTDELAKVSANDTTAGYLNGKLVAGDGIALTENNDGGNETLTVAVGANQVSYYNVLCALLEPDALEAAQKADAGAGFTYAVGAAETKYLIASDNTRLGASGRMEVRNPYRPMALRDTSLVGGVNAAGTSLAMIMDPTIPSYTDPVETYYERLLAIDDSSVKNIVVTAATQYVPLLPGAYGAIITQMTNYEFTWIIGMYSTYGFNLDNEEGDAAGEEIRASNQMRLALDKRHVSTILSGAAGANQVGSVSFVLLPSTWSVVTDPLAPYDFRDDFMGATLDTVTDWNRTVNTTMEIDTLYQWLECEGDIAWGTNGIFSQTSIARAVGKVFLCDVYVTGPIANGGCIVGFHDGAGYSFTDFAHGLNFGGAGGTFGVFENGNNRGAVGAGYSQYCTYRVRITIGAAGAATYEIQGGTEYQAIGAAAWTDITPGVTSSATDPLHAGVTNYDDPMYVSDVRMY